MRQLPRNERLVWALILVGYCGGCGGSSTSSGALPPSAALTAWAEAAKLADAGPVVMPLYGGPKPPTIRLEGLSDGTAFAVWERAAPSTVASARFSAGRWDNPVEGSGKGRDHPWLAVGTDGRAIVIWGEDAPAIPGHRTRWAWARRYLPGSGWLAPERLQSAASAFYLCCVIGANFSDPPLNPAVVLSDGGDAQAFWNREYATSSSNLAPSDVYSTLLPKGGGWTPEEPVALDRRVSFFRVSRTKLIAFWSAPGIVQPQVFDAAQGWHPIGRAGHLVIDDITLARDGFAFTQGARTELIARGLSYSGETGPPETLISNTDMIAQGAPGYDLCGNESGALGFVQSAENQIILKYRSAFEAPPTFTIVSISATARAVAEPVVCDVDSSGALLVAWRSSQETFANRYVPGKGLVGTLSIGPRFATTPAITTDAQGNTLVAWAVLTADNKVEIWWNRWRNP